MDRVEKRSNSNNLICNQQEVVAKYNDCHKTIYACTLDTRKAYDTVWQKGLFYQLYQGDMCCKTWRMITELYNDYKCIVKIGNKMSESFNISQGIHQGAPLSLYFFTKCLQTAC